MIEIRKNATKQRSIARSKVLITITFNSLEIKINYENQFMTATDVFTAIILFEYILLHNVHMLSIEFYTHVQNRRENETTLKGSTIVDCY